MKPETMKRFVEIHTAKYPRVSFPSKIQQYERCLAALGMIINVAFLMKQSEIWAENEKTAKKLISGFNKDGIPPRVDADIDRLSQRINAFMGNPQEQQKDIQKKRVFQMALLAAILYMDAANTCVLYTHGENLKMYAVWQKMYAVMAEIYDAICEFDYAIYEDLQPLVAAIYKNHLG